MRLRLLLLLLLTFTAAAFAGCGNDDDKAPAAARGEADASAFPVTIKNQLGTATIDELPERVVALDFDSADAAIALGVTPVGMASVDYAPGKVQPWTRAALEGKQPELFTYGDGPPLEQIAALRPDLIVATNTYEIEPHYDKLSKIAPVVASAGDEGTDRWQTTTLRIGKALGREDQAKTLVADTEQRVRAARKANPDFGAKTITLFNLYEGEAWAITREDASIRFLEQLGFVLSPKIDGLPSKQGRAVVSSERFQLLDSDVLVGTSQAPGALEQLRETATFERLPVVERGGFVGLDLVSITSIAFPSALSVRWGLEQIVPKLAKAAERRS